MTDVLCGVALSTFERNDDISIVNPFAMACTSSIKAGDDVTPTPTATNNVATKSTRKKLKRALKGTVGSTLAITAAILLARSEEIGEWLRSVAPNVMPDAAAGAEVVRRAIEQAKTCVEKEFNVCLDAEGRVTALCKSRFQTTRRT